MTAQKILFISYGTFSDLEEQKAELTRQQNEYKILLKSLEDDLLMRLSSAGDNILSDSALVENLEFTKKTAADIEIKVIVDLFNVSILILL